MRQALAWWLVSLATGWHMFPSNDVFFLKARKEIDSMHQTLDFPDNHVKASDKVQETAYVGVSKASKGSSEDEGDKVSNRMKSDHGTSKIEKKESSYKGHSGKEKMSKKYKEQAGKKQNTNSKAGHQESDHVSHEGGKGKFFKDKLLHKSGNYEKGYSDKYHLDETLKHDKFWNDHQSMDKFHKYGKHGSHFKKVVQKKEKKSDKKESEEKGEDGKKGEIRGGRSSSKHKGHSSKKGAESNYNHKEEYHKKKY